MKFSQFLVVEARDESIADNEGYKEEITQEQVIELIKKYCKNVDLTKPLYRGMGNKSQGEYLTIEGQKGGRKSQNTTNHYTLIIDKLLKDHYSYVPQRSKSIICTSAIEKAHKYGAAYVILPYDNTEIGMCESEDIWDTEVNLSGITLQMNEMNHYMKKIIKFPSSYKELVDAIVEDMKSDKPTIFTQEMLRVYKDNNSIDDDEDIDFDEVVENSLYDAYEPEHSLNMKFGTYKELEIEDLDDSHEFWIGGKVIAIHHAYWKDIRSQLK